MLRNQARNPASLPSSVVGQLRANLATTQRLIAAGPSPAYDVTNLDREFQRLYPGAIRRHGERQPDVPRRAGTLEATLNGLQTTMQMQAQASQNLSDDESVLADLVGKSQSAVGALQAMQATNQPGLAGQAVHPDTAPEHHSGSCRFARSLARQAAAVSFLVKGPRSGEPAFLGTTPLRLGASVDPRPSVAGNSR